MATPIKSKDKSKILVCPICGSKDVQVAKWIKVNTNEVTEDVESQDPWCDDCGSIEALITQEEYEDKEKEVD